jgi:hypothetical protein
MEVRAPVVNASHLPVRCGLVRRLRNLVPFQLQ